MCVDGINTVRNHYGMSKTQKWNVLAKAKMKEARISQYELADRLNVTQGAIGHWLNGRREPTLDMIIAIFKAIGITGLQFDKNGEVIDGDAPEEKELIPVPAGETRVPVISYVQAGAWTETCDRRLHDGATEYIQTDIDLGKMSFALEVRGDSMKPDILEGDVVIVDPDVQPVPGDYVVAKNGSHEATIKRYRPRGTNEAGEEYFELVPANPDYPSIRSDHAQVMIIGVVMERRVRRRNK